MSETSRARKKLLLGLLGALLALALGAHFLRAPTRDAPLQQPVAAACYPKFEMNSKEYWDCRFATGDWQARHGPEQGRYFYQVLIDRLPEPFRNEIRSRQYSVVDFGCAQGEGTEIFALAFPDSRVTGVDISTEAIRIAGQKKRKAEFLAADLTTHAGEWDVLITSNTLEHFYRPWEMLDKVSARARRYLVILVPYGETNVPRPHYEHVYSFSDANIPRALNAFKLVHGEVFPVDPRYWRGSHVLLIYQRQ